MNNIYKIVSCAVISLIVGFGGMFISVRFDNFTWVVGGFYLSGVLQTMTFYTIFELIINDEQKKL